MNNIKLTGIINDIEFSHMIQGIEFYKATLLTKNEKGKEDLINLKFKRFSCPYKNGDLVSLEGNIRTYSQKLENKNKVTLYVFTYFDVPEKPEINKCELNGFICKKAELRKTSTGKDVLDFILANNIQNNNAWLNCYIPCVAWGKQAKELAKVMVGQEIKLQGILQSRCYSKNNEKNELEYHLTHELCITDFEL